MKLLENNLRAKLLEEKHTKSELHEILTSYRHHRETLLMQIEQLKNRMDYKILRKTKQRKRNPGKTLSKVGYIYN